MHRFGVAMIAGILCACSARGDVYTRGAVALTSARPEPNNVSVHQSKGAKLYVVNAGNSTVSVFDLADRGVAPILIAAGGLYGPSGAALDASGDLYVTNPVLDRLSVFDTTHDDRVLRRLSVRGIAVGLGAAPTASRCSTTYHAP